MTSATITSEPLTYRRDSSHSYFRDLHRAHADVGAADRLERHRVEMDVVLAEKRRHVRHTLDDGREVEYRVSPNTTPGQGGYLTVPLWLNELFAPAPRPGRVLAALIKAAFPLPAGVSSVNVPALTAGTAVDPDIDNTPDDLQDITDANGSSVVTTISGHADIPLQMLEQSPHAAAVDWALFKDLSESYDAQVETQLLNGAGAAMKQILGVLNVANTVGVTYTDAAPKGSALYPYLGQAMARVGNNRNMPPECWLMRTSRWGWLRTSTGSDGLPFDIGGVSYLGSTLDTPDPVSGLTGLPVFLDDALPANLGAGANQDVIVALRPSDLLLFEAEPTATVMREVLSSTLGVRVQMHNRVAAITNNRYPSGISPITGTGMVVQAGFNN